MRCLIIARELAKADPTADIRFLVNRHAVFRESVNFPIIDCDASPTNSTSQVLATIESFRPDVMVFDNSGRTSQLRAAKRAGARLVFSSRAPKLRWKAFRIKWMRLLDEHWIVFPTFVTGGLSRVERLKLRIFPALRRAPVRHAAHACRNPRPAHAWLAQHGLQPGAYVVFVPGGRGEATRVARTGRTLHRRGARIRRRHRPAHGGADRVARPSRTRATRASRCCRGSSPTKCSTCCRRR